MKKHSLSLCSLLALGVLAGGQQSCGFFQHRPPVGGDEPWLTPYEAYEDQTAHTAMDGGAFVTWGLKIRDPHDLCREEDGYVPATHAIHNGSFETLESGECIYVRHEDGLQRRSTWVSDADKCLLVDESGCLAQDIYAFDGYYAGPDGAWVKDVPRLTADTRPVNGRKYREADNPTGPYLSFDMQPDGTGTVVRVYPGLDFRERYVISPFGRGTFALEKDGDPETRAHLALLPDGRTALLSQAGQTDKFVLDK